MKTICIAALVGSLCIGGAFAARRDALRPSKNLKFDGRSVEAMKPSKYDSVTHLDEGDQSGKRKRLYQLPKDFSNRIADESTEMGYRK